MEHELDVRGLRCPVPLVRTRALWPSLREGDVLVVLATDPEAPIDLAAFAGDVGAAFTAGTSGGVWRMVLVRSVGRGTSRADGSQHASGPPAG